MSRRRMWALLALVVCIGAALRIYRLDTIPGGLHFDEAANLFDILELERGSRPVFFPANRGREPLFIYAQLVVAEWLGPTTFALRVTGAIFGILTLPAIAFAAYQLFAAARGVVAAREGAVLTAAVLAGTYWHLHFSRFGLRTVSLPLFETLAVGLLWLGLRKRRLWPYLFAGAFGGLALYTYIAARLLPVVVLVLACYLLVARRWSDVARLVAMGLVWIVVAAPLGAYFVAHPEHFVDRANDISLLDPANHPGGLADALRDSTTKTLLMFVWRGSHTPHENLPLRPWFDPVAGGAFILGLVVLTWTTVRPSFGPLVKEQPNATAWVTRPNGAASVTKHDNQRAVALFVLAWLGIMLLPSILTVHAPAHLRLSGAVPPATLIATVGFVLLSALASRLLKQTGTALGLRSLIVGGATTLLVATSAAWTVRDYFIVWAPSDDAFFGVMAEKSTASEYLMRWANEGPVFLAPLYAQDSTIRFLTRTSPPGTFDVGRSVVVPTRGSGTVRYAFPAFDHDQPEIVRALLPVEPISEIVYDATGQRLVLRVLRLDADRLPTVPEQRLARFGEQVDLVNVVVESPEPVTPGQPLTFVATWLAHGQTPRDLTLFFHLRDRDHKTVAQYDGQPSGGRYPTTRWRPGELIVERYTLTVPSDLPAGDYRLIVGVYDATTMQRQPAHGPDGTDFGTEFEVRQVKVGG